MMKTWVYVTDLVSIYFPVSTVPLIIVNSACIVLLLVFGWQGRTERQHEAGGPDVCQRTTTHSHLDMCHSETPAFASHLEGEQVCQGAGMGIENHNQREEELTRHLPENMAGVDTKRMKWKLSRKILMSHYMMKIRSQSKTFECLSSLSWYVTAMNGIFPCVLSCYKWKTC